jgi:hypothetical protein
MTPAVVYDGVRNDSPNTAGLFAGQKFWLSSTVPQRTRFIEDVKANGGEVVPLEKQADICLYDHARKNPPPGMYSYRYVEHSVRNGQLEDLETHRIGGLDSRAARPVGSVILASKGSRTTFTEADDRFLWEWVKPHEGLRGAAGNVIYQQLEAANPRHTYQSWRDRWLKYVQHQKRDHVRAGGQRQHNAAPEQAEPAVTKTPRQTPNRIGRPRGSPRIVVEVPVQETPKRGRPRPRKIQQDGPDDDTISVTSLPVATQLQTPAKSMPKKNGDTPRVEKPATSTPKSKTSFREFSDADRTLLFNAAEVILEVPEDNDSTPWELMAAEHQSHTAEQWRRYFHEVIAPEYRDQQRRSSKQTIKKEESDAELHDQSDHGDTIGSQSDEERQEGQIAKMSSKKTRQNGIRINKPIAADAQDLQSIPSFEPQSPVDWKSENDAHRPAPNQSRKRSPAKSNSQESVRPQSQNSRPESTQTLSQSNEMEQRNEKIRVGYSRPAKRRKLSLTDNTILEIPSTPQPPHKSDILEELAGSPTPRARKHPSRDLEGSFSPLLVPSGSEDEASNLPTTPKRAPETQTSPISVHLVSDRDPGILSTSESSNRGAASRSTSSPTPEFETAPDFSPIYPDNPEEQEEASEEFETAAEEQQQQQPASRAKMLDTQALFVAPIHEAEEGSVDLGLAEPEGGWEAIEADPDPNPNPDPDATCSNDDDLHLLLPSAPPSPTPSNTTTASTTTSRSTSTQSLTLDNWLHLRTTQGRDAALLLTAATATTLHKKLADEVYTELEAGRGIPRDKAGVWTDVDDQLLRGTDARAIQGLLRKHGRTGVDERLECLEVWGG